MPSAPTRRVPKKPSGRTRSVATGEPVRDVAPTPATERFPAASADEASRQGALAFAAVVDATVGEVEEMTVTEAPPLRSDVERDVAADDRRRRGRALSAAGDLRSRMVKWFTDPSTPVIVPIERVARAFDLDLVVTVEVVDGIVEAPPPGLVLTKIRHDVLRVSRASDDTRS